MRDRLRRYLTAYWLRPENAFWMALRSDVLARVPFVRPAADVACGDGVFSFLHLGGRFEDSFDVFTAAGELERVHEAAADMFDVQAQDYDPPVVHRPCGAYDVGCDLKPRLLAKAKSLGLYKGLWQHDCNVPLPFPDDSFALVYCNSAYWLRAVDSFLAELRRVTRPGGRIVLHVKLAAMRDYTLERFRERLGGEFLRLIDRGRRESWPTVASRADWERRFAAARLAVESATPFVTRTHAHLWDVGLRPIAPLLVRMANALTPATRAAVKRDWVALFESLLEPICKPDFELLDGAAQPAEIQYVLTSQ